MADTNLARFEPRQSTEPTSLAAYQPRDFDGAWKLATAFAKSGLLAGFQTPEQVLLVMATGAELGIPPTTALRGIHVINGKPVMSADLLVALVLSSPLCESFRCTESTDTKATYETKRRGNPPVSQSFTVEDARRAGLIKSGSNHEKYPRQMLRHRAASELARLVYPDVVLGLYVEGEIPEPVASLTRVEDEEPVTQITPAVVSEPVNGNGFAPRIEAAATPEDLAAIRAEMKAHYQTVPPHLVAAWRERERMISSQSEPS